MFLSLTLYVQFKGLWKYMIAYVYYTEARKLCENNASKLFCIDIAMIKK